MHVVVHSDVAAQIKQKVTTKMKTWLNLLNCPVKIMISTMEKVGEPKGQGLPAKPSTCFLLMMKCPQLTLMNKPSGAQMQNPVSPSRMQTLSRAQAQFILSRVQSQAGQIACSKVGGYWPSQYHHTTMKNISMKGINGCLCCDVKAATVGITCILDSVTLLEFLERKLVGCMLLKSSIHHSSLRCFI